MRRIPSLDGLRAISILLVVFSHLGKSGHAPKILWGTYGIVGVQMFFVISGFLITRLLLKEQEHTGKFDLKNFYVRRACRIFPAALVFIAIATIFYWRQVGWTHLAAAAFYLANFDDLRPWIFGHLWSLSVEEQFYLCWPAVLRRWYARRKEILIAAIVLAPVLETILYLAKFRGGNVGAYPWAGSNLAFGCLLAVVEQRVPAIKARFALSMVIVVAMVPLFAANTPARTLFMTFLLQPLFYLSLAGILIHVVRTPYRMLNVAPVIWLGKISYSLYLWQQPFCADPALRHGYYLIYAIAAACLSYYLVELPVLRWRDNNKNFRRARLSQVEVNVQSESLAWAVSE